MKLLRTSAVLLVATAAAVAAMLATSEVDAGSEPTQSARTAGSGGWGPDSQMPSFAPSNATWAGVFNANSAGR